MALGHGMYLVLSAVNDLAPARYADIEVLLPDMCERTVTSSLKRLERRELVAYNYSTGMYTITQSGEDYLNENP